MDRWNGLVKSGDQNVPGNYRGISLRSTVCKMRREEGEYLGIDRKQRSRQKERRDLRIWKANRRLKGERKEERRVGKRKVGYKINVNQVASLAM